MTRARRGLALLALLALALPLAAVAQAGRVASTPLSGRVSSTPEAGGGISRGVVVLPETVTVGDPFRVVVRIRAPRGATLEFPQVPDSGTGVEPLDPVSVVPTADSSATEQTATYRLAAWDVGARPIRFPDILVRDSSGVRRVPVGRSVSVFVASVLPADSTERVPKPARALYEFGPPWWWWAIVALAALGVLLVVWWLWRRRRTPAPVTAASALDDAVAAFARVEALGLIASGERSLHVALMADVLRGYLERVLPAAEPSLTSSELLHVLRNDGRLPLGRLARFLQDVDLVKFAAFPIDASRADVVGREARSLAQDVDASLAPRVVPAGASSATAREAA